ncbi:sorting nexin-2 [Cichlidogyrus casuarinus]|uniref:Sorting nexin-2 n=1 Tax=Cichlidogyrus casuarinus TaxID=1844966 RepID=A0ABD2QFM9_9PLAT
MDNESEINSEQNNPVDTVSNIHSDAAELDVERSKKELQDNQEVVKVPLGQNELEQSMESSFSGKLTWNLRQADQPVVSRELTGSINVEIKGFDKIGDGMGAYVLFTIITTTDIPVFRSKELIVKRRFSDFLGLYQKLLDAYSPKGILVPPPPDKQNLDSNKYKIVKDSFKENEFLEQRRVALLHFLENLIRHPNLRTDPILREFLEFEGTLQKATNTQAISSSTASKFLKTVGDAFSRLSTQSDDSDEYFFEKTQQLNALERQFTRIMHSFNSLAANQSELSCAVVALTVSLEQLSTVEQENHLAVDLKGLSDVYSVIGKHEAVRAQAESVYLCEMSRSIVATIQAAKMLLEERSKAFRRWKETEESLGAKRAQKMKLELSGRIDSEKSNFLQAQIQVIEQNSEECKTKFNAMCKTMKEEFKRFELHRFYDLRASMLSYLEVLLSVEQKNEEAWENYLQRLRSGTL